MISYIRFSCDEETISYLGIVLEKIKENVKNMEDSRNKLKVK